MHPSGQHTTTTWHRRCLQRMGDAMRVVPLQRLAGLRIRMMCVLLLYAELRPPHLCRSNVVPEMRQAVD